MIRQSTGRHLNVVLMLWLIVSCGDIRAEEPQANLEVMRSLASVMADSIGGDCHSRGIDSITLDLKPGESAWLIEGVVVRALSEQGVSVVQDSSPGVAIGIREMGVEYSNLRGSALIGGKDVDRRIYLKAEAILSIPGGTITSHEYDLQKNDSVPASAIPMLENRAIPATVGRVPEEGFFQNLTEPLILIGALVVGVFLLFNVRS